MTLHYISDTRRLFVNTNRCTTLYFEYIHLCDARFFYPNRCATLYFVYLNLSDACLLIRTAVRRLFLSYALLEDKKTNVSLLYPKQIYAFTHTSVYTNTHTYATYYLKQAGNVILINVYSTCVLDPLNDIQSNVGILVA